MLSGPASIFRFSKFMGFQCTRQKPFPYPMFSLGWELEQRCLLIIAKYLRLYSRFLCLNKFILFLCSRRLMNVEKKAAFHNGPGWGFRSLDIINHRVCFVRLIRGLVTTLITISSHRNNSRILLSCYAQKEGEIPADYFRSSSQGKDCLSSIAFILIGGDLNCI